MSLQACYTSSLAMEAGQPEGSAPTSLDLCWFQEERSSIRQEDSSSSCCNIQGCRQFQVDACAHKIVLLFPLQDKGQEQLVDKLPKTLGFGMGLEFRESSLLISSKSQNSVKAGMIFNVSLGGFA